MVAEAAEAAPFPDSEQVALYRCTTYYLQLTTYY